MKTGESRPSGVSLSCRVSTSSSQRDLSKTSAQITFLNVDPPGWRRAAASHCAGNQVHHLSTAHMDLHCKVTVTPETLWTTLSASPTLQPSFNFPYKHAPYDPGPLHNFPSHPVGQYSSCRFQPQGRFLPCEVPPDRQTHYVISWCCITYNTFLNWQAYIWVLFNDCLSLLWNCE